MALFSDFIVCFEVESTLVLHIVKLRTSFHINALHHHLVKCKVRGSEAKRFTGRHVQEPEQDPREAGGVRDGRLSERSHGVWRT